jgi:glycosyltransferase involved in cell wall biosynthesis
VTTSPQLKIAHLYQESGIQFCEPQAAQLHIYHTLHGLQQAGHQVTLLALQGRQVLCTPDLQVFQTDQRLASQYGRLGISGAAPFKLFESGVRRLQTELHFPYLALFDSFRMAEAGRLNLKGFHLLHERFNLLSLGGAWASRRLRLPLVLEVNADQFEQRKFKGIPERGLRRLVAIWATRLCYATAEKIICISSELKEHLRRRWNIAEAKLVVLPCAADVDAFGPRQGSQAGRRRLGLTTEPVVIWVGGFFPWHDLELLLQSFAQVLPHCPNARLVLVGDGQTRPAIEQQVLTSGLKHAVIFTGSVPHNRVPELVAMADVAVVPAAPVSAGRGGTGTPLKLFEYMAAGKAIVATALNQAVDVMGDGQTGRLVAAGNVHGFAQAMLALLSDAGERARLGHNARQLAVEQYSWEQYTRRLEAIYFSVLGKAADH